MAHIGFKTRHGTKTSLVSGSLTDLRLVVTYEPFPASKTKKGLKAESERRTLNVARGAYSSVKAW